MPCMLVSVCGMKLGGRGPSWKVGVPLLVSYCKAHPVSRSQTNKIPSLFLFLVDDSAVTDGVAVIDGGVVEDAQGGEG